MDKSRTPAEEDDAIEAAVLQLLLALHPAQVTFQELLRLMTVNTADFDQRDAADRAVNALVAVGLAHRNGEVVFVSRAAMRCDELLSR